MFITIAVGALILMLGSFLLGWNWAIEAYDQRSRRQAARQRQINEQIKAWRL